MFQISFDQHCRDVPPPTTPLLADTNTATDSPHHNNHLYNIQYKTAVDLGEHCKQDLHKYAVFADSGRDVFWEFEPSPAKQHLLFSFSRLYFSGFFYLNFII